MNRPTLRPVTRRDVLELTLRSVASLAFVPAVGACGAEDSPPPSARRIEFTPATVTAVEALAEQCMLAFDAPGAAFALLQGGEVIYAKGFGVRNLATGQPFTPDTVHRIASTSKSMSAMLVARHVDEGAFGWDTPVHEVWPSLRLPSAELTQRVTIGQLMGMGTGIGGNPIELYADLLTPEAFLAELATLPVISPPGPFFYQSDVYALAAYLRDLKRGIAPAGMTQAYAATMKASLFEPMGMRTTAISDDPSTVSSNYAVSYGYHLPDGIASRYLLPFAQIRAAAPAGSVCTTLNDMARYLLTQLNRGVAPGGARVVSAANLTRTWQPQTKIDDASAYGMGWFNTRFEGVPVREHAGAADGFKTDMVMLPDHGLGMLFFTNSESGAAVLWTLRTFLFDALAGKPSDAFDRAKAAYAEQNAARQTLRDSVKSFTVRRADALPHLGDYEKAWRVELDEGDRLWLTRASGYRMALLPIDNGYLIASANHLSGFGMTVDFTPGADGNPRMTVTSDDLVIDSLARTP